MSFPPYLPPGDNRREDVCYLDETLHQTLQALGLPIDDKWRFPAKLMFHLNRLIARWRESEQLQRFIFYVSIQMVRFSKGHSLLCGTECALSMAPGCVVFYCVHGSIILPCLGPGYSTSHLLKVTNCNTHTLRHWDASSVIA